MDRLDELLIFTTVVSQGSLSAAARQLRRSAPAVTRAIAALEKRLGTRLLERTTRKIAPTPAGLRLAERARMLLEDYQEAVQESNESQLRGMLRLTAPVQFGRRHVTPVVMAFLSQHPDIQIELLLNDHNQDLIEQSLDMAVRIGDLKDSSMVARQVGSVSRMLAASPAYLAARGTPVQPCDLAHHDVIAGALLPVVEWRFDAHGAMVKVPISPRLITNDVEAQCVAARAGYGIVRLLSYQLEDDFRDGSLVHLLPEWEPAPLPVQLVAPHRELMPRRVRAFWEFACAQLQERLQEGKGI
ncbi:LysR family transcriptional regulator [Dickeya zeae]|uniref:LysR family transcriptional regulator n=1 Tax=Dickeya zeae TaxID=204042 RepID=UPI00039A5A77|nr:LysR family transcriptional regulator [Dickeya zeae]AUQ25716.1 transcriptional regulator [Dickeya zeae]